jgi:hypothetical protein
MDAIARFVTLCDGTIYGGYPRDLVLGVTPKNIDAWFQFDADFDMFINMCPDVQEVTMLDGDWYRYFHVNVSGYTVGCMIGAGYPDFDYECNSLAITSNGVSSMILDAGDINGLFRIMNDIRSKVAVELAVDPKRRVKMWTEGWKIMSKDLAASKIQAQFRKAMAVPYYDMCKRRLQREWEEMTYSLSS